MEDQLGELDASENGWTAKPPPWRDKNDVVCWKPRGIDKSFVQSVAGAYGNMTLARMMRHYNGLSKGFGFIKLFNVEDARIAMDSLNGKEMHFQGLMPTDQEVPVKKLSLGSRKGLREFINEVNLLLKVQHQNLVMLLRCCVEGPEKMVVYNLADYCGQVGYYNVVKYTLSALGIEMNFELLRCKAVPKTSELSSFEYGRYGNLLVTEICGWAATPEIYHLNGGYTDKSDVGLVGITALELVFGGIQVKNREGLELLIAEVTSIKGKGKMRTIGMKKTKIGKSGFSSSSKRDEVTLSRSFKGILTLYLTANAGERPTAAALMQHDFFKICDGVFNVDFMNAMEVAATSVIRYGKRFEDKSYVVDTSLESIVVENK